MKALVGAFNQEKALVGAFSVIVKTGCGTDGALYSTSLVSHEHNDAATINCFYNNILSRLNLLLNESSILFRAGLLLSGAELYIQLAEKTRRYFTQIDLLSF